jgi:hypothetical protein
MPVTLTIHPCRTAREREEAHRIERRLDLKRGNPDFCAAREALRAMIPTHSVRYIRAPRMTLVQHADEHGRACATVLRHDEPFITLTNAVE